MPASNPAVHSTLPQARHRRRWIAPGLAAVLLALAMLAWLQPSGSGDAYERVSFSSLGGFAFDLGPELLHSKDTAGIAARTMARVPEKIRALDGHRVAVRGFGLPMKIENGRSTEFLLLRDRSMCCYGIQPMPNQWITVRAAPPGVRIIQDMLMTVCGTLRVGDFREAGYLVSIYEMDAEKVICADEN